MVRSASSAHHWDKYMNTFVSRDFWEFEGCLEVGTGSERKFDVVCGFDTQYGTWVYPNPASKNWRRGGNDLQADMPPLHEIKVVEGTQDGIPTTFVHLNRIKPVAQAPSKTNPSLQPKSVKQADEEGPADGNEISKKQKSNCKQMLYKLKLFKALNWGLSWKTNGGGGEPKALKELLKNVGHIKWQLILT
ncbi:HET domain-containing protein [Colletotrichum acutatum]